MSLLPPTTPQPTQSSNPVAQGLNITVSIPETINIKLVDASALNDFEVWTYISSALLTIMVAFWVWNGQNTEPKMQSLLNAICDVFTGLFILGAIMVAFKRRKLAMKTKSINIQNPTS